jgi:exopolyphosphatase / guanosine-5'-triphosphate,3'-diphosphate pyrophosphatase
VAPDPKANQEDGLTNALEVDQDATSASGHGDTMKVAVVDVGYNSLKMVKYKVDPDGSANAYGQLGVMAKLGEGLENTGYLGREPVSRTIDAIRLCREAASLDSIKHVLLVGTSPVREAANREEFLRRVQEETGLRMRVLAGNEEALYAYFGAAVSVGAPTSLFFDLGGGSLELTYAEKFKIKRIVSLPLGALKLTSRYAGKDGTLSRKNRARLAKLVFQALPSRRELGLDRDAVLVGTGGTVRAMARYQQDESGYPLNKIHNYVVDYESVQRMSQEFLRLKRGRLDGLGTIGEGRSETIAAGALTVRLLMKRLGFTELKVSTHGLRDGILAEFLQGGRLHAVAEKDLMESMLTREEVPARISGSLAIAEALVKSGAIDSRQEGILLKAVLRGRSPDCHEADPNALFWILMSEDLPLSHEDQIFMAICLVKARRPRTANWLVGKYGNMLPRRDVKAIRKMASCIKLMEILDRSSAQVRVAFSAGLRISIVESGTPFPIELARSAALGLSSSIKKPVTVFAAAAERERHAGLLKAGS